MKDIAELFKDFNDDADFTTGLLTGLGGSGAPPFISLKNDRFAFVDEGGERTPHEAFTLNVIIIGSNPGASRVYWGRPYDGTESDDPPKCWSDNQIGPSIMAPEPQSLKCAGCEKAQWGSAVSQMTGKGIPACSERKKIAVIVPEHNSDRVWSLTLPPTSRATFGAYIKTLVSHSMGGRSVAAFDVITQLSVDENKVLQFKPVGQVTPEAQERIIDIWKSGKVKEVTGATDRPITALLTGPTKQGQIEQRPAALVQQTLSPIQGVPDDANGQAPAKRGPGRPRKLDSEPEDASRADPPQEVPAFLRRDASASRGGVVAEAEKPKGSLMDSLTQAFKLNLNG